MAPNNLVHFSILPIQPRMMETHLLNSEIRWLKAYFSQKYDNEELSPIQSLVCSFTPDKEVVNLNCLVKVKQFSKTTFVMMYASRTEDEFFVMKQEKGDNVCHEFFIGVNIKNLLPTFSSVASCFCASHPTETGVEVEYNYIMYDYIEGKTFYYVLENKLITLREGWQIVKIVFESINYAYLVCGFIHQDLHFGNIIITVLNGEENIVIGDKVFTTKYLPKIIDYARAQIKVDGTVYSPEIPGLNIPAKNPLHDLRYLLWAFRIFDPEFINWRGDNDKDLYLYNLLDLPDVRIIEIYEQYDRKYL